MNGEGWRFVIHYISQKLLTSIFSSFCWAVWELQNSSTLILKVLSGPKWDLITCAGWLSNMEWRVEMSVASAQSSIIHLRVTDLLAISNATSSLGSSRVRNGWKKVGKIWGKSCDFSVHIWNFSYEYKKKLRDNHNSYFGSIWCYSSGNKKEST